MNRREMIKNSLAIAWLAVLPVPNAFAARNSGLPKEFVPLKDMLEPAPSNSSLAGGFSLGQVMAFLEVRSLISFARLGEEAAEKYLQANWGRVAAYSDALIADRSPPGCMLAKKIGGVPFMGPASMVSDKTLVHWVALDMLMEMWLKKHAGSRIFDNYCAFGLNITCQESRFMTRPGGYNGASGKQLTPNSILAGKEDMLDVLRPHMPNVGRYMFFEQDGRRERIVLLDGGRPYWNNGARSHIIGNMHKAAFYSALHLLYLHYDDQTRDLWRLASCYNGNNRMTGDGKTVRVNYANSVVGRLAWGWPRKPFSEASDRAGGQHGEDGGEYIEPYKFSETGENGALVRDYILPPHDAGARSSPFEIPVPMPDVELETNSVPSRERRAQVLGWERKWAKEIRAKNERLVLDGKIARLAPPSVLLPGWIIPIPLDWSRERLALTAQYAQSRHGKGSFRLVGSHVDGSREQMAEGVFVVDMQTHEGMEADSVFEPMSWYDRAAKSEGGKMVVNSSVHFLVGRTGEIYLISPLEAMCNVGRENKEHMETRFSVGVVHDKNAPISIEQQYAIARVSAWLETQALIPDKKDIVGYAAGNVKGIFEKN